MVRFAPIALLCALVCMATAASPVATAADRPGPSQPTVAGAMDQVLCIAGCGSVQPVVVYERPRLVRAKGTPVVRARWTEHVTGLACSDRGGCRGVGMVPLGRRYGHDEPSTSIGVVHMRWHIFVD